MTRAWLRPLALLVFALGACVSVGEGKGFARSADLYVEGCWDGAFDLRPDFFAADPFREQMHLRLQRGNGLLEVSDGIVFLIDSVDEVRSQLGEEIEVTLSPGVAPPGFAPGDLCVDNDCDSPVHAAVYLLDSCNVQNTVLYAVAGTVVFDDLFSGDPNEDDPKEKFSAGRFSLQVGDPRTVVETDAGRLIFPETSTIEGSFEFFFQRGQPAQPFP
jgi:hypothetical protein